MLQIHPAVEQHLVLINTIEQHLRGRLIHQVQKPVILSPTSTTFTSSKREWETPLNITGFTDLAYTSGNNISNLVAQPLGVAIPLDLWYKDHHFNSLLPSHKINPSRGDLRGSWVERIESWMMWHDVPSCTIHFHHGTASEHPAMERDDIITTNLPITRPLFWAGDYSSNLPKTWGHVVSRSFYIDIHYLSYMMS